MVTIEQRTILTRNGTGWVSLPVAKLAPEGRGGRITEVEVRMDAGGAATAVDVYIAKTTLAATPADENVFYRASGLAPAGGHATTAFWKDPLGADAKSFHYTAAETRPYVGVNITAGGAGASTFTVTSYYEIDG